MNKTININLAGIIFHLDEGAYESFKDYLNQVKNALESQEGGAEIIADIEARIAELFSMRMQEFKREAITIEDVNFIQATLGAPQDFEDDSDEDPVILLQGYLRVRNGCFEIQMSLSSAGLQVVSQPILEQMSFGFVSSF